MSDGEEIPPEMTEANRLVREAALKISEHVDSVRIFVTKKCENGRNGTWRMSWGEGNWFAQYGQVSQWIDSERENSRDWD